MIERPDSPTARLAEIQQRSRPPREPKQRRSREKRDRILLAAARLFAEHGVDSTTTKEIARRAQVSIGTLYSYFTDRRQILLSLVADNAATVLGPFAVSFELGANRKAAFQSLLQRAVPYDPDRAYLRQCWADLTREHSEVRTLGEEIHKGLFGRFRAAAELWSRMDDFRTGLDLDSACWAIMELFDSLWHLPNRPGKEGRMEFESRREAVAQIAYSTFFTGESNAEANE